MTGFWENFGIQIFRIHGEVSRWGRSRIQWGEGLRPRRRYGPLTPENTADNSLLTPDNSLLTEANSLLLLTLRAVH